MTIEQIATLVFYALTGALLIVLLFGYRILGARRRERQERAASQREDTQAGE